VAVPVRRVLATKLPAIHWDVALCGFGALPGRG
jgi:hypothetical protein